MKYSYAILNGRKRVVVRGKNNECEKEGLVLRRVGCRRVERIDPIGIHQETGKENQEASTERRKTEIPEALGNPGSPLIINISYFHASSGNIQSSSQ